MHHKYTKLFKANPETSVKRTRCDRAFETLPLIYQIEVQNFFLPRGSSRVQNWLCFRCFPLRESGLVFAFSAKLHNTDNGQRKWGSVVTWHDQKRRMQASLDIWHLFERVNKWDLDEMSFPVNRYPCVFSDLPRSISKGGLRAAEWFISQGTNHIWCPLWEGVQKNRYSRGCCMNFQLYVSG